MCGQFELGSRERAGGCGGGAGSPWDCSWWLKGTTFPALPSAWGSEAWDFGGSNGMSKVSRI